MRLDPIFAAAALFILSGTAAPSFLFLALHASHSDRGAPSWVHLHRFRVLLVFLGRRKRIRGLALPVVPGMKVLRPKM